MCVEEAGLPVWCELGQTHASYDACLEVRVWKGNGVDRPLRGHDI